MEAKPILIEYLPGVRIARVIERPTRANTCAGITARRKALGYTQAQLAKRAGISRTYLSKIECGEARNLSLVLARQLADALHSRVDDLFPPDYGTH